MGEAGLAGEWVAVGSRTCMLVAFKSVIKKSRTPNACALTKGGPML